MICLDGQEPESDVILEFTAQEPDGPGLLLAPQAFSQSALETVATDPDFIAAAPCDCPSPGVVAHELFFSK